MSQALDRIAYSPEEAGAVLGITRVHVYTLIRRGMLRSFKVGRCTRIPVADVRRARRRYAR